jgi:hypothetical protein
MRKRPASAFDKALDAPGGERAEFERIACELERIAAWLRSRDPNSDSHLPRG